MTAIVTEAIVLHAFDYRETSRILRLATREAGVRSVIARGARRSKQRFGAALDLFAQGTATIAPHPTGDLHTLSSFEVTRSREALAAAWQRFTAANALSEIMLRFARDDAQPDLFDAFESALDSVSSSDATTTGAAALGGAWRLVAELGFAPSLDVCASCGTPLASDAPVRFAHRAGGGLCPRCAQSNGAGREIPPAARATIGEWISGAPAAPTGDGEVRAHQRLLREFLVEHLADERPLRAFGVWEHGTWIKS